MASNKRQKIKTELLDYESDITNPACLNSNLDLASESISNENHHSTIVDNRINNCAPSSPTSIMIGNTVDVLSEDITNAATRKSSSNISSSNSSSKSENVTLHKSPTIVQYRVININQTSSNQEPPAPIFVMMPNNNNSSSIINRKNKNGDHSTIDDFNDDDDDKDEISNRNKNKSNNTEKVSLDQKRRLLHKEIERRRRVKINDWIMELAKEVPDCSSDRTKQGQSKGGILAKTVKYIKDLQNEVEVISKEKEDLRHETRKLKKRLEELQEEIDELKSKVSKESSTSLLASKQNGNKRTTLKSKS